MKQGLITIGSAVVFNKIGVLERIPVGFIQSYAGEIELGVGVLGYFGAGKLADKWSGMAKAVALGMAVSGAEKCVSKYILKG